MAITRPRLLARGRRVVDASLLISLALVAAQTLQLPADWRDALSPHASAVDRLLRFEVDPHRSLSLDPQSTAKAALISAFLLTMFWTCREMFDRHGVRPVARALAGSGFAVSIVAIVCKATAPTLLYATWSPGPSSQPYGPFINRNHMGSWLVMTAPFVVGYLIARLQKRSGARGRLKLDALTIWLGAAAAAMYAASILSLSRSTFLGMVAAGLSGGLMAVARRGRAAATWFTGVVVASLLIAAAMPRTADLVSRFEEGGGGREWSRLEIWHDTLPIVQDFPLTGIGVGAYRTAMVVYQQADRQLFFNQAHNQYLQLAAEGGLLLGVPLVIATIAFAAAVVRKTREDRSPTFWIRAGAVAGIVGIAVQSLWETGLRMPANGLLFAALCAAAIHEPGTARKAQGSGLKALEKPLP